MARKIFEKARTKMVRRSAFDLSHEVKTSQQWADLNPIMCKEVLPGDQFAVNSEVMVRMAPTIAPIMHRIDVYVHHFFVPNRIVWDDWEKFIFPVDNADTLPVLPTITANSNHSATRLDDRSLWARLGLPTLDPTQMTEDLKVNALPFRAYTAIWNEYYRDENLQAEIDLTGTTINSEIGRLRKRAWEKDYFTSALPFSQKGPAVLIPAGTGSLSDVQLINELTGNPVASQDVLTDASGFLKGDTDIGGELQFRDGQLGTTIEDLRRSARLQEWLERAARGGTRYKEALKSFFGMNVGDARLDRPEYLGGGKQPITISEVLNTTGITGENVQGDMAGHGIAVGANNAFKYTCKEHGHIISILSILPKTAYQQGIERNWSRQDRYDYYWHEFANLGEQQVVNKELYYEAGGGQANENTFGYQQRYAEYKYDCDKVSGDFRTSLDFWHVGRQFNARPTLNSTFITPSTEDDLDRIFAVQPTTAQADQFWIQVYNSVKARRPMPYFSNPTL